MSTATMRNTDGVRRNQNAVTTALTTGSPPLIIPVIDELTVCSAIGVQQERDCHPQRGQHDESRPVATIEPAARFRKHRQHQRAERASTHRHHSDLDVIDGQASVCLVSDLHPGVAQLTAASLKAAATRFSPIDSDLLLALKKL